MMCLQSSLPALLHRPKSPRCVSDFHRRAGVLHVFIAANGPSLRLSPRSGSPGDTQGHAATAFCNGRWPGLRARLHHLALSRRRLSFVTIVLSLSPIYLLVAMLVMLPLNALVFGLDNLIYLLYPYRVQQEGLEIFFRTMLTFTGKGLLFTIGLAAMSAWGLASTAIARNVVWGRRFYLWSRLVRWRHRRWIISFRFLRDGCAIQKIRQFGRHRRYSEIERNGYARMWHRPTLGSDY